MGRTVDIHKKRQRAMVSHGGERAFCAKLVLICVARLIRMPIFFPHPEFSSQSEGPIDLVGLVLARHRAALHDSMVLSYGPARSLEQDRRRGFRAWVGCVDR
jgi:hypothetical protein